MPKPPSFVRSLQEDVARSALRARNGIKHVAGIDRAAVAPTPRRTVWQSGKARLWRFRPDVPAQGPPLVIVYSLVSRSYVMDLNPKQTFVGTICDAGIPVYLLDWGIPDEADAHLGTPVYAAERIPAAIRAAVADSGADSATVLGYCLGGTLSLLALGLRPQIPVLGFVAMATPVDFRHLGLFTNAFGPGGRMKPDDLIDGTGNVPPEVARDVFRTLKPTAELSAYVSLWENLWNDEFMRSYQTMNRWTRDHVPFPGQVFRELVELLFQENALVNGSATLRDRPTRLADITMPTLVVAAENDHIVPLASAEPLGGLLGADDVETLIIPSGHVGLVAGAAAAQRTLPAIVDWLLRSRAAAPAV